MDAADGVGEWSLIGGCEDGCEGHFDRVGVGGLDAVKSEG